MGWDHDARQRRLAPVGEYEPKAYRVVVHDSFYRRRLEVAALDVHHASSVAEFLLHCAEYVITHRREFKRFRAVFRKGRREILAAVNAPVDPAFREPESERLRRRRKAMDRFSTWAGPAIRGETPAGGKW
jgi:hypothetical protein